MEERKIITQHCEVCGKEFEGPEPVFCCNMFDCGCQGLPLEPIVCSEECYDKLVNKSS